MVGQHQCDGVRETGGERKVLCEAVVESLQSAASVLVGDVRHEERRVRRRRRGALVGGEVVEQVVGHVTAVVTQRRRSVELVRDAERPEHDARRQADVNGVDVGARERRDDVLPPGDQRRAAVFVFGRQGEREVAVVAPAGVFQPQRSVPGPLQGAE